MIIAPNLQQLKKQYLQKEIHKILSTSIIDSVDYVFDLRTRVRKLLNIDLEDNQLEIVQTITDPNIRNICLVASRSGGKTFSTIVGITLLSIDGYNGQPITIGITAPKAEQAGRIINEFKTKLLSKSPYLQGLIDKKATTNTRIVFKNGSYWESFSGDETANEEGRHYDMIVIDESQHVSDIAISQIIYPMIGHSAIHKVMKLGIPRGKAHFYRSFHSESFVSLSYDWLKCGNLFKGGVLEIDGKKFPKSVIDRMPISKKQEYFPNNPEMWTDSAGLSVEDFESQYEVKWLETLTQLLTETDQAKLLGDYDIVSPQTDIYYFGLDLAGGEQIKTGNARDYTSLSIFNIKNGIKRKINAFEFQGSIPVQMEAIIDLIHPIFGKYKCKSGLADYGQVGPAFVDILKSAGIPITGVMFGSRDSNSGKNMKNAMFDHALFELRCDRFKYPNKLSLNKNKTIKKHYDQWCLIERQLGVGINDVIQAPSDFHDDGCCSDVLCLWGIDKTLSTDKSRNISEGSGKFKLIPFLKGNSPYGSA